MFIRNLIFCLIMATVMAEPPVLMDSQHRNERVFHSKVHAAKPHVYQQLPQEYSFGDFLPPPVSTLDAFRSVDLEIPLEDSYNTAYLHSSSQQHQTGYDQESLEPQVHKHIYVHAPPLDFQQEDDIQPRLIHQTGRKQKHYKIVFIKAPDAPSVRTPLATPLPQNEEKTIIYVLHKKPETHPNVVIPTPEPTKPSKPEVYFIKYKSKRPEAPVYGPPPAFEEFQSRQANENNNILGVDEFMPLDRQQNEIESSTSQSQYDGGIQQQQKQANDATEVPSGPEFYSSSTQSSSINENLQTTTVEPINQYLPPETTLSPIVVKSMDETVHLPAATYSAPTHNRFFIKRRK